MEWYVLNPFILDTAHTHTSSELLEKIFAPIAPSTFATASGWVPAQLGPYAIDCLRPPERCGLSIVILHPAFAKLTAIVEQPIPDGPEYVSAAKLAAELCQEMPKYFDNEEKRAETFQTMVASFFSEFNPIQSVGFGKYRPGASISNASGSTVLIIEYKNEPGHLGNVHMQASRSFDAMARSRPIEDQNESGCPAFVVCIDGK